jgi:hypothetical protein
VYRPAASSVAVDTSEVRKMRQHMGVPAGGSWRVSGEGTHAGPLPLRRRLARLIADDEQLSD